MNQKGDCKIETPNKIHDCYVRKKTLEFILSICIISFFFSYFPGFPFFSFQQLQFPTRKSMFLICNGILAFLAKNLSFEEKHAASVEYDDTPLDNIMAIPQHKHMSLLQQEDEDYGAEKKENVIVILEDEDEEEEDQSVDDEDADVKELEVSTEELNHKFEEFIRRMKEEIRIHNM